VIRFPQGELRFSSALLLELISTLRREPPEIADPFRSSLSEGDVLNRVESIPPDLIMI